MKEETLEEREEKREAKGESLRENKSNKKKWQHARRIPAFFKSRLKNHFSLPTSVRKTNPDGETNPARGNQSSTREPIRTRELKLAHRTNPRQTTPLTLRFPYPSLLSPLAPLAHHFPHPSLLSQGSDWFCERALALLAAWVARQE